MNETDNIEEYLEFYHWTVSGGLICGLDHPIEWAVNAIRTPGATFTEDYYKRANKLMPQYLYEMYAAINCGSPMSAQDVLEWCDDHYKQNKMCQGFFDYLEKDIQEHISKQRRIDTRRRIEAEKAKEQL